MWPMVTRSPMYKPSIPWRQGPRSLGEVALGAYLARRHRSRLGPRHRTAPGDRHAGPAGRPIPDDPDARTHWLVLELYLNPDTTWLHMPRLQWPADVGELITNAFPESGSRYKALVEQGVYVQDK